MLSRPEQSTGGHAPARSVAALLSSRRHRDRDQAWVIDKGHCYDAAGAPSGAEALPEAWAPAGRRCKEDFGLEVELFALREAAA